MKEKEVHAPSCDLSASLLLLPLLFLPLLFSCRCPPHGRGSSPLSVASLAPQGDPLPGERGEREGGREGASERRTLSETVALWENWYQAALRGTPPHL